MTDQHFRKNSAGSVDVAHCIHGSCMRICEWSGDSMQALVVLAQSETHKEWTLSAAIRPYHASHEWLTDTEHSRYTNECNIIEVRL